ncbi:hypothetical protein BD289DRAFT_455047 [Coniella lustricola]|uniref:Uncharacterized protein n=1 Tax=Coniella lustricola TaxID=2025994 RepID=A0A2T3A176_9PEZI|nr:hypothetical protein BD289DRAFT_455047 [Coniella lustricola]
MALQRGWSLGLLALIGGGGGLGLIALTGSTWLTPSSLGAVPGVLRHAGGAAYCSIVSNIEALSSFTPDCSGRDTVWCMPLWLRWSAADETDVGNGYLAEEEDEKDPKFKDEHLRLRLKGMLDTRQLESLVDAMVAMLMKDLEENGKRDGKPLEDEVYQKHKRQFHTDLHESYVKGMADNNLHLEEFASAVALAHGHLLAVQREVEQSPAASKPRCASGDWKCSLRSVLIAPQSGMPARAVQKRTERIFEALRTVRQAGDKMAEAAKRSPHMAAAVCRKGFLDKFEQRWAGLNNEYKDAAATLQDVMKGGKRGRNSDNKLQKEKRTAAAEEEAAKHGQTLYIWHETVNMLLWHFGQARLEAASLTVFCAEFDTHRALVQKLYDAWDRGVSTGVLSGKKEVLGMMKRVERIAHEVDNWSGADDSELGALEIRMSEVCQDFGQYVLGLNQFI